VLVIQDRVVLVIQDRVVLVIRDRVVLAFRPAFRELSNTRAGFSRRHKTGAGWVQS